MKLEETFLGNNVVISYRLETEKEKYDLHILWQF